MATLTSDLPPHDDAGECSEPTPPPYATAGAVFLLPPRTAAPAPVSVGRVFSLTRTAGINLTRPD